MHRRWCHGGLVQLASTVDADLALSVLAAATTQIQAHRASLDALDSEIGDGDHGTSLAEGFARAYQGTEAALASSPASSAGEVFLVFGQRLREYARGASGGLYAALFMGLGRSLADISDAGLDALAAAFTAAAGEISHRGGARPGEATMLDSVCPYAERLRRAVEDGEPLALALDDAYRAACEGAEATTEMVPIHGRARSWGKQAVGHVDPGARSFSLVAGAFSAVVGDS